MKYHIEKKQRPGDAGHSALRAEEMLGLYPDLFQDETAVRLIGQIDYDFSALERKVGSLMQGFAQGKRTAARSGRSSASRCSLTVGSRCPTCRSAISIRSIGTCSPRRVNARGKYDELPQDL